MRSTSAKHVSRSAGGTAAIIIFLLLFGLIMALPLLYTILQSLKPLDELFIFPPRFFVRRPTLENFIQLKNITSDLWVPFSRYLFNSVFLTVFCTAIQVVFASMAAYPLAKHKFPGQKVFFNMVVLSLLFTNEVTFIPLYIMLSSMHLINSYMALILPVAAFPLGLYLMRQNLLGFPDSVIESARIDGAKEATIFWHVIMPSNRAVWMTMLMFSFSSMWNRSDTAFIYTEAKKSLPTILAQLSSAGIARMGVGAAISVFMILPPILIFLITQSGVMETMANSGMKE
ncbi:carbohydrate ABC transporter permease [Anaeromassilibacillus sp. SJQ-5]